MYYTKALERYTVMFEISNTIFRNPGQLLFRYNEPFIFQVHLSI